MSLERPLEAQNASHVTPETATPPSDKAVTTIPEAAPHIGTPPETRPAQTISEATEELGQLRAANTTRVQRWHGPDSEPWTGADWSNAMCGEAGETANVVKKLRRHETGAVNEGDPPPRELLAALGDEIADTIIYLDLLAYHYGIELWPAIVSKFNRTGAKYGFPEALPLTARTDRPL